MVALPTDAGASASLKDARTELELPTPVAPGAGVVIRTVASGIPYATGIATDPVSGDLFVTEPSFGHDDVIRVSNPTSANPTVAPYAHPGSKSDGIAFGPDGTLYVSVCCSAVEIIAGTSASGLPDFTRTKSMLPRFGTWSAAKVICGQ